MLKFELKKIFKKRILLFFIFISIILPIYKLSILKYGDMVIVDNEKSVNSIGQIFDRAEDKVISSDTLSDDEKKSYRIFSLKIHLIYSFFILFFCSLDMRLLFQITCFIELVSNFSICLSVLKQAYFQQI